MSDFIVNGPDVFTRLRETIIHFYQEGPAILEQIHRAMEEVLMDLNKDQLETEGLLTEKTKEFEKLKSNSSNQQDSKSNENHSQNIKEEQEKQHEIHRLNTYKQELINAQANIKGLGQRVQQLKGELNTHVMGSNKGIQALIEFENIANKYLQYRRLNERASATTDLANNVHQKGLNTEITGNTLHVKKLNNLSQRDINEVTEEAVKYNLFNNNKILKVSISKVSKLDFNVLEQNGFTIQELAPNEYSAYKEL